VSLCSKILKMKENFFKYENRFYLESGAYLPELEITYHTAGEINSDCSNVIWVCHALTANSNVADWWDGLFGDNKLFNPQKYFIICANFIGSCYGSTGPLSVNSETNKPYYNDFPLITVRDIIKAHELLRINLQITKIHTLIGGSIGGFQVLEWAVLSPQIFDNIIFIASNAKATPWNIAFNQSQRMAIEIDPTFFQNIETGGLEGMKTARSFALISYRNQDIYNIAQKEKAEDDDKIDNFRVSSYQKYQGEKLAKRFNAYSYYSISKTYDSHNLGRKRNGIENALKLITAKILLVSISSDLLFPPSELEFIHKNTNNSVHEVIDSFYGHDGFLLEFEKLTNIINKFYNVIDNISIAH